MQSSPWLHSITPPVRYAGCEPKSEVLTTAGPAGAVEELAAQAQRIDINALVIAGNRWPNDSNVTPGENSAAIGDSAALAVEPASVPPRINLGRPGRARHLDPPADDFPQLVVGRRACRLAVLQHADLHPRRQLAECFRDVPTGRCRSCRREWCGCRPRGRRHRGSCSSSAHRGRHSARSSCVCRRGRPGLGRRRVRRSPRPRFADQ